MTISEQMAKKQNKKKKLPLLVGLRAPSYQSESRTRRAGAVLSVTGRITEELGIVFKAEAAGNRTRTYNIHNPQRESEGAEGLKGKGKL